MSSEILSVLEYMEKEKGISREDMIATISHAILTAAQKGPNAGQDLKIEINPRTGALKAWAQLKVVDSVADPAIEIHIERARQLADSPTLGSVVLQEINPSFLGRIAAQAARQAILQRIRQFERDRLYDDYKDLVGKIVTGSVLRWERDDLIIDLGKTEAVLPMREQVPGEEYSAGERVRCLLMSIEAGPRGPELILSRASGKFVRCLLELEVSEIADGTVILRGIARDPGYRTKITVDSKDPKVDPVGACVGARGARVKSIVRELGGEKIDVIRYYTDPKLMLEEAIKPTVPKNVHVDELNHRITFEVEEAGLSMVLGRKGHNARLTSRLLGWKLYISKERQHNFDQRMQRAIEGIGHIPGISEALAERLVDKGFTSPEVFEGVTASDLVEIGFTQDEAESILKSVNNHKSHTS